MAKTNIGGAFLTGFLGQLGKSADHQEATDDDIRKAQVVEGIRSQANSELERVRNEQELKRMKRQQELNIEQAAAESRQKRIDEQNQMDDNLRALGLPPRNSNTAPVPSSATASDDGAVEPIPTPEETINTPDMATPVPAAGGGVIEPSAGIQTNDLAPLPTAPATASETATSAPTTTQGKSLADGLSEEERTRLMLSGKDFGKTYSDIQKEHAKSETKPIKIAHPGVQAILDSSGIDLSGFESPAPKSDEQKQINEEIKNHTAAVKSTQSAADIAKDAEKYVKEGYVAGTGGKWLTGVFTSAQSQAKLVSNYNTLNKLSTQATLALTKDMPKGTRFGFQMEKFIRSGTFDPEYDATTNLRIIKGMKDAPYIARQLQSLDKYVHGLPNDLRGSIQQEFLNDNPMATYSKVKDPNTNQTLEVADVNPAYKDSNLVQKWLEQRAKGGGKSTVETPTNDTPTGNVDGPPTITNPKDLEDKPSGFKFIDPNGVPRTVP